MPVLTSCLPNWKERVSWPLVLMNCGHDDYREMSTTPPSAANAPAHCVR